MAGALAAGGQHVGGLLDLGGERGRGPRRRFGDLIEGDLGGPIGVEKARLLLVPRQPGENHPFIVGADGVQRYFTVMAECAMASKLRVGAK